MQDYEIINADCLSAMQEMPDGCVDAIVTDPPYGLGFMGVAWDTYKTESGKSKGGSRTSATFDQVGGNHHPTCAADQARTRKSENEKFQASMIPIFAEALRVAKPGAHMLCFGGTRTFHRLACSLEDAGWEIRDTIMWVYGSGFPKSMDVGKAIDKALGAKREQVRIPASEVRNPKVINSGHGIDGGDRPWMKKALEVGYHEKDGDVPVTDQAKEWDGWGTCLKPAWEPIIVARKPLDGTVAHNVMTYGTGAINIDGCRVPTNDKLGGGMRAGGADGVWDRPFMHDEQAQADFVERKKANVAKSESLGRFPANLVHDGSQEVLELFPEVAKSTKCRQARTPKKTDVYGLYSMEKKDSPMVGYEDGGTAARFFYCAKASRKDRGEGNDHPTVKPNALMRWLVRLVCPQGGMVLDPFMGSGSTGVACIQEGMQFVGIDMEKHYCEIANARISKETDTVFCENQ